MFYYLLLKYQIDNIFKIASTKPQPKNYLNGSVVYENLVLLFLKA